VASHSPLSVDQTRQVVEGFLEDPAGYWLAEDVECVDWAAVETIRGRAPTMAWLRRRWPAGHPLAVIGDGVAAIESEDGVAPMAGFLVIRGGEIVELRFYGGERQR
jgi:hypothetical protein